jgi:hypothetical protein
MMDENSGRNNYLFSFGVFLKKKDPDFWEQQLFEINAAMQKPLPKAELEGTIINSLRKKDYTYKCTDAPCVDFCRKPLCKTREFGIGKEGGYFSELEFGKLFQIKSYEPYYEWEVKLQGPEQFSLLRFKNEDEIIRQDAFLKLCFRDLHTLPIKMKQSEWFKLINQALSDMQIKQVETEYDSSPMALFKELVKEFLNNRSRAVTKDQILGKRVFYDEGHQVYYFRSVDMSEFVWGIKNFRYYNPGELHGFLRDFKAKPTRIRTETDKQIRVYEMSRADVNNIANINVETFKANFEGEKEQF